MSSARIISVSAICTAGNTPSEIYNTVCNEQPALTLRNFGGQDALVGEVNCKTLEEIDSRFNTWPIKHQTRNNRLLWQLFKDIESDYLLACDNIDATRIGIVIGTSTSGNSDGEAPHQQYVKDATWPESYDYHQQDISSPSVALADALKTQGPVLSVSTACSSGASAIASAKRWIEMGACDLVICGGVDTLCELTVKGFNALGAVSDKPCLPMSANRSGINLGEGGALFLISKGAGGIQVLGSGISSDAHHFSAPHPDGVGAQLAMEAALVSANLTAKQIDYLNLHGTATKQNDSMESKAVERVLGGIPCSSTKSFTGHTLAAAGAVEAAICYELLSKNGRLPLHVFDNQYDPSISSLNVVTENTVKTKTVTKVMSNSFAFGGSNVALVLGINDE